VRKELRPLAEEEREVGELRAQWEGSVGELTAAAEALEVGEGAQEQQEALLRALARVREGGEGRGQGATEALQRAHRALEGCYAELDRPLRQEIAHHRAVCEAQAQARGRG
jgi:hypothetical protein